MQVDNNVQKQQNSPLMIIAMKGRSSSSKRELACKIADFFKCPLIDQDDINIPYQKLLPNSPTPTESTNTKEHINDLLIEILYQVASTQLSLNIRVIINAPLSRPAQFDCLVHLALLRKASLIIVECIPDKQDEPDDDYVVGNIPKLVVPTTKPLFDLQEFASVIISRASEFSTDMLPERLITSSWNAKTSGDLPESSSLKPEEKNNIGDYEMMRKELVKHVHEFTFYEKPGSSSSGSSINKLLSCKSCQQLISGPIYQCVKCDDEFVLHSDCAEFSPNQFLALAWRCFPPYLWWKGPEHMFPETVRGYHFCEVGKKGDGLSYHNCYDCLFEAHVLFGMLPTIVKCPQHQHDLSFTIVPVSYNYEYQCCSCGDIGNSISYKCYACKFDLHVHCALNKIKMSSFERIISPAFRRRLDLFSKALRAEPSIANFINKGN